MMEVLNDDNFLLYASKQYQNKQCTTTAEFLEDLNRIKYIKKLLTRFKESGDLKERLILNHLIVLSNVFEIKDLSRILWLKMEKQFDCVKPFLILLNIMPDEIESVRKAGTIDTTAIQMNPVIVDRLRNI